jgi:hypothetical protein
MVDQRLVLRPESLAIKLLEKSIAVLASGVTVLSFCRIWCYYRNAQTFARSK